VLAILAPGQGSQTPGQLAPWLQLPGASERLRWWSSAAGVDLIAAGTTATADEIRDTSVAQPLLVATALLAAEALLSGRAPDGSPLAGVTPAPLAPDVVTGHSVGEVAAAALCGAMPTESALLFIRTRGEAMARAAAATPTGMSALLGGDPEVVVSHLEGLGLTAANRNGAGQIVAAGDLDALDRLKDDPPDGARVRPLPVAGAFHTGYMKPAQDELATVASGLSAATPAIPIISNADGAIVTDGDDLVGRLIAQVSAPVRFDLCLRTLAEMGVTAVIELPPAGTLAGLVKRELPGVSITKLAGPDDLPAARELLGPAVVDLKASELTPSGARS
jgi:[acyl-carrier-protein] S-malonyltransferase